MPTTLGTFTMLLLVDVPPLDVLAWVVVPVPLVVPDLLVVPEVPNGYPP
jgi:hypothetical protein